MTLKNLFLFAMITSFLATSCEKETMELVKQEAEVKNLAIEDQTSEKPQETLEEISKRMQQKNIEFLTLTEQPIPSELRSPNTAARSPHSAYNSGRISVAYPSVPTNGYDLLNFGTRTGTTQWIAFNLNNSYLYAYPDQYSNNRPGKLLFTLSGVGQTVTLNFSINPYTLAAVITPSTTASLHSRVHPNTSFTFSSDMSLVIHSNTNGWLWLEVKKANTVVFSSLYRYNYNSSLDARNGGNIRALDFGSVGVGPRPPYSLAGITTSYSGHCGWF